MATKPTYQELEKRLKELEGRLPRRMRAGEALQESGISLQVLLETIPHGIQEIDRTGTITFTNSAHDKIFGYEKGEMLGKPIHELQVSHAARKGLSAYLDKLVKEQPDPTPFFSDNITKDGSVIHIQVDWDYKKDKKDRVVGFISIITDITDRRKAEESVLRAKADLEKRVEGRTAELAKINDRIQIEIAERKALLEMWRKYEFIVNTSNEFMTLINREYIFEAANDAYCKAWKKAREEILGCTVADIWGDKTFRTYIKMNLDRCFAGETVHYERRIGFSGREQRVFEVNYYPYYGDKGDVSHAVVVTHDITERKKAEQSLRERDRELERKTINLEEVNAALRVLLKRRDEDKRDLKEKVLLNIHEMIMPYLEKLKRSKLNERQKAFTEILESNLKDIASPFSHTLSSKYLGLTPTELQVANLIRQGINTKGIAELLHVSSKTVETHRDGLRKKLGLKGKKANLRTHLMSFR